MDINRNEPGHATVSKRVPTCDDPIVEENRLNVSPTVFNAQAPAMRSQGVRRLPRRTAVPPTTSASNSRSPIGYATLTAADRAFPPVEWMML
jgi:hypothetical protein